MKKPIRSFLLAATVWCATPWLPAQTTVFHYRVFAIDAEALPTVPSTGGSPGTAVGNFSNAYSDDVPAVGVPQGAGNRSLVGAGDANSEGVNSAATRELLNATVIANGGFTYECWFKWFGGGTVNSVIDYAGTEKIRIPSADGYPLDMRFDSGSGNLVMEAAPTPNEWHYVAMVFAHDGNPEAGGQISGTATWYYDSNVAAGSAPATKDDFGDSLNRVIGVGRHPNGFSGDHFDGLIFEPRVTLGVLAPAELLYQPGAVRDPAVSVAGSLDFGVFAALPGATPQSLQVDNLGPSTTLTLSNPQITGAGAGAFSVTAFPASIGPQGSDVIEITFDPAGGGAFAAQFTFETNDAVKPLVTVELTGEVRDPAIVIDPSLDFGVLPNSPGATAGTLFVDNFGEGTDLLLSNPQFGGPGAANYTVTNLPASLPPFGSDEIEITFDPGAAGGSFPAILTLESNDPFAPTVSVILRALVAGPIDLEGPSKVSHWTFDDPANLGDDSGGLDYDGTVHGEAASSDLATVGSGALQLDGDGDYIEIPQGALAYTDIGIDGDGFTIATWVCSSSDPTAFTRQRYFSKFFDTGGGGFGVGQDNDNFLLATTYGVFDFFGGLPPLQDEWHHFAYVFRGSPPASVDYYEDGVFVGNTTGNLGLNPGPGSYAIGGLGGAAGEWFDGLLDDLRVYAVELSNPDLEALAAMGTPGRKGGPPPVEIILIQLAAADRVVIIFEGAANTAHQIFSSPDLATVPFSGPVTIVNPGLTTNNLGNGRGRGFVEIDISGSEQLFFQIQEP